MSDTYTPPLSKVSGQDYLEVKHRVYWIRQDGETRAAQLITDLVSFDYERGYAVVKAIVTLPNGAIGTGYGMAERGGGGRAANRYVEFAETRAIGRACAAVGYGTLAALDEDDDPADAPHEARRAVVAQEPRNRPPVTPNPPAPANGARPPADVPSDSLPTGIVINPGKALDIVAAGRAFRAAAETAGYSTREAQDQFARDQYPGRKLGSLTEADWRALELRCRAMYSDVPAPEEAPIF